MQRLRTLRIALAAVGVIWLGAAAAQPRSASAPRPGPALPESGHQTEAIDLNEGKTPAQMFASDCAVCHQRPHGLAKGRNASQLATFLRQHYTTGTRQAGMIAAYLTSGGLDRGAPAPAVARDAPERPPARERAPVDRPPAAIGRRQSPDADDADPAGARRKPLTEASRPAERDTPAGRRQSRERDEGRKPTERTPAAPARASTPAPEVKPSDEPVASAATSETPATETAAPPREEKPAAPQPPPVPEIRI